MSLDPSIPNDQEIKAALSNGSNSIKISIRKNLHELQRASGIVPFNGKRDVHLTEIHDLSKNDQIKNLENVVIRQNVSQTLQNNMAIPGILHNTINSNYLLNDHQLNQAIAHDPWKVDVKKTLSDLQNRMYPNPYIKFRIGGKAIYSASQIVRAKSNVVIQDSQDTQNELKVIESQADDLGAASLDDSNDAQLIADANQITQEIVESINDKDGTTELLANLAGISLESNCTSPKNPNPPNDQNSSGSRQKTDLETPSAISGENNLLLDDPILSQSNSFFNIDSDGTRYLQTPSREIFQKLTFHDLGKALLKTLSYQVYNKDEKKRRINGQNENITLLPETLLKKAEEDRALVELQIQKMFGRVQELFHDQNPVCLLRLILSNDPLGIVNTLLYILQLVNRKKVEIWQKISPEEAEFGKRKLKQHKNSESTVKTEQIPGIVPLPENNGNDIYVTPLSN